MADDFTVVFKMIEEESSATVGELHTDDLRECNDISELARLSEALKEPEFTSFLMA